jgi:hypothetical protein
MHKLAASPKNQRLSAARVSDLQNVGVSEPVEAASTDDGSNGPDPRTATIGYPLDPSKIPMLTIW